MLKATDVNDALLRQAVDDLEIGVPIRSWDVVDGKLVFHLAYGRVAVWPPGESVAVEEERVVLTAPHSGREYYWTGRVHDEPLPEGDLSRFNKDKLASMAGQCGLRYLSEHRLYKADYVDILTELREKEREATKGRVYGGKS